MIWNKNLGRDPICGKKQEVGKGIEKDKRWYCSDRCLREFEARKEHA
jgi:YHS domain-containing protein